MRRQRLVHVPQEERHHNLPFTTHNDANLSIRNECRLRGSAIPRVVQQERRSAEIDKTIHERLLHPFIRDRQQALNLPLNTSLLFHLHLARDDLKQFSRLRLVVVLRLRVGGLRAEEARSEGVGVLRRQRRHTELFQEFHHVLRGIHLIIVLARNGGFDVKEAFFLQSYNLLEGGDVLTEGGQLMMMTDEQRYEFGMNDGVEEMTEIVAPPSEQRLDAQRINELGDEADKVDAHSEPFRHPRRTFPQPSPWPWTVWEMNSMSIAVRITRFVFQLLQQRVVHVVVAVLLRGRLHFLHDRRGISVHSIADIVRPRLALHRNRFELRRVEDHAHNGSDEMGRHALYGMDATPHTKHETTNFQ